MQLRKVYSKSMKPAMYIFLNRDLGMSTGKAAAQACHAAVEAYKMSRPDLTAAWEKGGHTTKLVMLAETTEHLLIIQKYIEDRDFKTRLIIDEGRTEVSPHSPTALGVEIVDKDDEHTQKTFEGFRTYKEKKPLPTQRKKFFI